MVCLKNRGCGWFITQEGGTWKLKRTELRDRGLHFEEIPFPSKASLNAYLADTANAIKQERGGL